jgi:cation diffusion facilitator family transporter
VHINRNKASGSAIVVIVAVAGNVLIAVMKFIAGSFTGSSAMFSEGIHSVVDTGNGLILLYGLNRSQKPSDKTHQFGYGRELYFWSLIVAVSIFGIGGGVSLYEGVLRIQHPADIADPFWNYAVLGASFLFDGTSWLFGWAAFRKGGRKRSIVETVRRSKDPSTFMVLLEDSTALFGLAIALIAIFLGHWFDATLFDGLASVLIGLLLVVVALLVGYKAKELLIGEAVDAEILHDIQEIVESETGVRKMLDASTVYIGPQNIALALKLRFDANNTVSDLQELTRHIEQNIRKKYPEITNISYRN